MSVLYAVGGTQKPGVTRDTDEWHHYAAGLIVSIDIDTGRLESQVEYISPPEVCASSEDPSIVFKSATLVDDRLYVPTQTEVMVYELPSFQRLRYVSLPCFNDVHHVRPSPQTDVSLLVANTGLDMVVEVGPDDEVQREWSVIDEDPWDRFSRDVDYRKVLTTKPHRSHPNHVFTVDGEIWATRCDQRDIICLSRERHPIPVGDRPIHDGLVRGESVYFTVVNGEVVEVGWKERRVVRRFRLKEMVGQQVPLGWCRGLEFVDDDHVVVAFSRLRPTQWKENLRWVRRRLGGGGYGLMPTSLVMIDLRRRKLCWEIDLEPTGMNAVFSVHRAP